MFAQRLRELRIEKDLSQKELADVLDISNRTISMYETGNSEPNVDILVKLSKFFDVTSDYLIGLTDVRTTDIKISQMSKALGLSERCINELQIYNKIALTNNSIVVKKIETLNKLFEPNCELLDHIAEYINFTATHFKNFYNDNSKDLSPISDLELWDDDLKLSYSEDCGIWSKALLFIVEDDLIELRKEAMKERYNFVEP